MPVRRGSRRSARRAATAASMGSMTRKNITTAEITAGRIDAEHLLSLTSADAADAERAVPPFRLTQLVMARFDMDVVEAAVFLTFCGAATTPTPQNADAEFHAHLRRVIDRYRLDCLFVEDAPGQYRHTTRPRGYDYSVDAVHPKDMETWRADYRNMHSVHQMFAASIILLYCGEKDRVCLRRGPFLLHADSARHAARERGAASAVGR